MDELSFLIPYSNRGHAVKEVVLTVFTETPISDFESFNKLLDNGLINHFDRFEIINHAGVRISLDSKNNTIVDNSELKPTGFRLIKYQEGRPILVFQGVNENNRNYFSLHELNYSRWQHFFDLFKNCIDILCKHIGTIELKAYSLHVIDEFDWKHNSEIPYSLIFRKENRVLPSIFFESQELDYVFTRQNKSNKDASTNSERIQIAGKRIFNDEKFRLTISHNNTKILRDSKEAKFLIESSLFHSEIQSVHQKNKKLIEDILSENVLEKINFYSTKK